MATLMLTNVPDDLVRAIELRAKQNNRSVSNEAISLIREGLRIREREERELESKIWPDLIRRQKWTPPPGTPDSVDLLREDRDR